jgi:propionyl-CoA synthetase
MEEVVAPTFVAECAVIGIQDELKGQIPLALVVTKSGDEIEQYHGTRNIKLVRHQIGGLLLRNVYCTTITKKRAQENPPKTDAKHYRWCRISPSTIDDESIVDEIVTTLKKYK